MRQRENAANRAFSAKGKNKYCDENKEGGTSSPKHKVNCAKHSNRWDPYETTTKRDYVYRPISRTKMMHPHYSKGYTYPCAPINMANSCWQRCGYLQPLYPHLFVTYPNKDANVNLSQQQVKAVSDQQSYWKKPPPEGLVKKAMDILFSSTYQRDYRERSEYFKGKKNLPDLSCSKKVCCLPKLKTNCRLNNDQLQSSMIPTVKYSRFQSKDHSPLTTYERDFCNSCIEISPRVNALKQSEIERYLQTVSDREREVLEEFLENVTEACTSKVIDPPPSETGQHCFNDSDPSLSPPQEFDK